MSIMLEEQDVGLEAIIFNRAPRVPRGQSGLGYGGLKASRVAASPYPAY
jgi:hypothetical protein